MRTGTVIAWNAELGRGILEDCLFGQTLQFTQSMFLAEDAAHLREGLKVVFKVREYPVQRDTYSPFTKTSETRMSYIPHMPDKIVYVESAAGWFNRFVQAERELRECETQKLEVA